MFSIRSVFVDSFTSGCFFNYHFGSFKCYRRPAVCLTIFFRLRVLRMHTRCLLFRGMLPTEDALLKRVTLYILKQIKDFLF